MTTARETFNSTQASAALTKANADTLAEMVRQTTVDGAKSVVGYKTDGNASSTSYEATVKSSNATKAASLATNRATYDATIMVAKDTLRNAGGDNGAF
jgi:hypothetical protein